MEPRGLGFWALRSSVSTVQVSLTGRGRDEAGPAAVGRFQPVFGGCFGNEVLLPGRRSKARVVLTGTVGRQAGWRE